MNVIIFANLSFPQPKEASYEIWAKLAQGTSEKKLFENFNGWTNERMKDKKWSL